VNIDRLVNAGAMPTLETVAQFSARRHELIAHNIANISTPNFQHKDVPIEHFQETLGDAIDDRRKKTGGFHGELHLPRSRQIRQLRDASGQARLDLNPTSNGGSVLYHDRNNRDIEHLMQSLAENTAAFRTATELFKSRIGLIREAIALRV